MEERYGTDRVTFQSRRLFYICNSVLLAISQRKEKSVLVVTPDV